MRRVAAQPTFATKQTHAQERPILYVKALDSVEGEPTSALPNFSPAINRAKYRAGGRVMTQYRAQNNLLRKASPASSPCALPMACITV